LKQGPKIAPTIAFPVTIEFILVMEGKNYVSNNFFFNFLCHTKVTGIAPTSHIYYIPANINVNQHKNKGVRAKHISY